MKWVIVRDMWLTGFDAPCLHTIALEVGDVILEIFGQEVEDKKAYIDASKRAKLAESQATQVDRFWVIP